MIEQHILIISLHVHQPTREIVNLSFATLDELLVLILALTQSTMIQYIIRHHQPDDLEVYALHLQEILNETAIPQPVTFNHKVPLGVLLDKLYGAWLARHAESISAWKFVLLIIPSDDAHFSTIFVVRD
jgi:hypothetical protein